MVVLEDHIIWWSQRTIYSILNSISGKYDLKVILADMYMYCKANGIKISPIKKGTCYFTLKMTRWFEDRKQVIVFKDLLNFTSPMSMDQYLQTWNGFKSKLIWPYAKYTGIEEIMADQEFPKIEDFFNNLKQVIFETQKFQIT